MNNSIFLRILYNFFHDFIFHVFLDNSTKENHNSMLTYLITMNNEIKNFI